MMPPMPTRKLVAIQLTVMAPVIAAFAGLGAWIGWFYGKEVGDSKDVWFRPGIEIAVVTGIALPLVLLWVPIAIGALVVVCVGRRGRASPRQLRFFAVLLLVATALGAWQIVYYFLEIH